MPKKKPAKKPKQPASKAPAFANNWDELAKALGISRRCFSYWKADARYNSLLPPDRADGRKDIEAWRAFMQEHGLARAEERFAGTVSSDPDELELIAGMFPPGRESDWKKKLLEQKVTIAEIEAAKLKGLLIEAASLELPLGATFVAIQNVISQFADRTAPLVRGFTDVHEIADIMRGEMDANLSAINGASYLDDLDSIVDGMAIAADLRPAVIEAASEALRRVGRSALANALRPQAVLHPETGQVTQDAAEDHTRFRAESPKAAEDPSPQSRKSTRRTATNKKPARTPKAAAGKRPARRARK